MNRKQVEEYVRENGTRTVIVAGTDPAGVLRGKRLTAPYFLKAIDEGLEFAWSILMTTPMDEVLPGIFDSGIHDIKGVMDLDSFRPAPWEPDTAVVLMDWQWTDGRTCELCPRTELKRQVARLRERGLKESLAYELEFFAIPTPVEEIRRSAWSAPQTAGDVHCYSIYEGHFFEPVVSRIRDYFANEVEGCMAEWGQGQFEVNLYRSRAVEMADTAVLIKMVLKQLAAQAGQSVTFMAKWHDEPSGSSGHIHQSLRDLRTGRPALYDGKAPHMLSTIGGQYVAGLLDALVPSTVFFAPFVNSYKRFQDESLAGVAATWGVDNRTTGVRVINASPGKARIEHRVGGADLNPYTAFAACIGAGLRGIEKSLPLPEPHTGNAYQASGVPRVPQSLREAADLADSSPVTREVLAPAFVDNLVKIARFEAAVFDTAVTDLERRRYYEMA